jgi:hypothetical protein
MHDVGVDAKAQKFHVLRLEQLAQAHGAIALEGFNISWWSRGVAR